MVGVGVRMYPYIRTLLLLRRQFHPNRKIIGNRQGIGKIRGIKAEIGDLHGRCCHALDGVAGEGGRHVKGDGLGDVAHGEIAQQLEGYFGPVGVAGGSIVDRRGDKLGDGKFVGFQRIVANPAIALVTVRG